MAGPRPTSSRWMLAAGAIGAWFALGGSRRRRVPAAPSRPPIPEDDAGRDVAHPHRFPATGWWMIVKRTLRQANDDRLMTEAAGVTFYTLLALFPAIAALVSIYGLLVDQGTVADHLDALAGIVPGGGMELIGEQARRVAGQAPATLGVGVLLSLGFSLWTANQATKAIFDALNVVYEEKEKRSFLRLTAVTLLFTLCGVVFAVLAMAAVVVLPVVFGVVGLGQTAETLLRIARWPLLLAGVMLILAALYRFGPSRERARWRWVSWGSAFAAVAWMIVSLGFSWYVESFGSYNETYGSLGAVMGFMTWIWISAMVVLLGGELNAEMEHQTARDTTSGPEKPMGRRGARMADTVAPR